MSETYNLSGDLLKFFGYYLTVKRPIYNQIISRYTGEKTNFTDVPLKILAYLLYLDYNLRQEDSSLSEKDRWKVIESKEYRSDIAQKLGFGYRNRINNYFSRMKKMGIISDEGINPLFRVEPQDMSVVYNIKLK